MVKVKSKVEIKFAFRMDSWDAAARLPIPPSPIPNLSISPIPSSSPFLPTLPSSSYFLNPLFVYFSVFLSPPPFFRPLLYSRMKNVYTTSYPYSLKVSKYQTYVSSLITLIKAEMYIQYLSISRYIMLWIPEVRSTRTTAANCT